MFLKTTKEIWNILKKVFRNEKNIFRIVKEIWNILKQVYRNEKNIFRIFELCGRLFTLQQVDMFASDQYYTL